MAAERRLAAATAELGVSTAELYPKLQLSASLGLRSLGFGALPESHSQRAAGAGLISWRIFDGGRVRAEIRASEARQQAAALAWERSVLAALADAERALMQYERSREALALREQSLGLQRRTSATALRRHERGDSSHTDWLDAEREVNEQELAVLQAHAAALQDLVALYKALGGGWEPGAGVASR